MAQTFMSYLATVLGLAILVLALLLGGRTERRAALAMIAALAASAAALRTGVVWSHGMLQPQWLVAAIDALLAAYLCYLAVATGRVWAYLAAACQVLGAASHFATALDLEISVYSYFTALWLWSAGVLLSLLGGVAAALFARRRTRLHIATTG